jgi:glyoxylase-like metal-dependent hydrolase (beta-lactamase superfamily II)
VANQAAWTVSRMSPHEARWLGHSDGRAILWLLSGEAWYCTGCARRKRGTVTEAIVSPMNSAFLFRGAVIFGILGLVISASWAQQAGKPARAEAQGEPLPPNWCSDLPRPGYRRLERVTVGDGWFEVYRIRPGVLAIYEPHQYEEVISYLILCSQRALLFDTGLGIGDMHKLIARLTSLPITVLNSHTHFDHIGDDWQFEDILGVDSPYTRLNQKGATHEQLRDAVIPERFCGSPPPGFASERYAIPPFKISRFVKDGDVIDLGGRQLEVLRTPGHTPDSLCLLDRQNKLLFTGDTFYAGPIFLYVPETSVADYRRSVRRLAMLVPHLDLLLPSHNFPAEKPVMLTRLEEALQEVQSGKANFKMDGGQRKYSFDGLVSSWLRETSAALLTIVG